MSVIKSGASSDQWTIDPTSKAGRVTLYDSSGNPLKDGLVSTVNSSSTPLNTAVTFTGTAEDVSIYSSVISSVKTDQSGIIYMEFSTDGANWDDSTSFSVAANTNEKHRFSVTKKYFRVRFTNSSAANQTFFRLQTIYGKQTLLNTPLNMPVQADNDSIVVRQPDPYTEIAANKFSGYSSQNIFGKNNDIDIGTEDIWVVGGTWVAPTTARIHDIASSSGNDTAAGTGARTIYIEGLNSSYNIVSETLTMNGVANVPTVNSYTMINKMYVLTAGSGGTNAGNITATAQTDATITCRIETGKAHTQLSIYQVPAGKSAFILNYYVSISSGSVLEVELYVKPFGGVFNLKGMLNVNLTSDASNEHRFIVPLMVPEKAIIKLTGTATANNTEVAAGYDLILVDN